MSVTNFEDSIAKDPSGRLNLDQERKEPAVRISDENGEFAVTVSWLALDWERIANFDVNVGI